MIKGKVGLPTRAVLSIVFALGAAIFVLSCLAQTGEKDAAKGAEEVGQIAAPLTFSGSIVREGFIDTGGASLVAADAMEELYSPSGSTGEGGWFVTAQRNTLGNATIQAIGLNADGSLVARTGWGSEFPVSKLSVVGLGLSNFVVGSIERGGLALRAFEMDSRGFISNSSLFVGEAATDFAMTRIPQADPAVLQVGVIFRRPDTSYKTVVFSLDSTTGTFTAHRADTGGTVKQVAIAAPLAPIGAFVTPVVSSSGATKILSYTVNAAGDIVRRSSLSGGAGVVSSISATAVGYGRFAIADTEQDAVGTESVLVRTFSLDTAGAMALMGSISQGVTTGPRDDLHLVSGSGARLFLTGIDHSGNLRIRSFNVANNNTTLTEVATQGAGAAKAVAALVLKASRLITSVVSGTDVLKTIAWQDYSAPLVTGFWPEAPGAAIAVTDPQENLNTFAVRAPELTSLVDLTIAAGDSFIIAGSNGRFAFYDKAGNLLPAKNVGVPTKLSLFTLFTPIMQNTDQTGAVNYNNINRYFEYQYLCDPVSGDLSDGAANPAGNRCGNDIYDTSVRYDAPSKRFIIEGSLRWLLSNSNFRDKTYRHTMLAVSKTEDPRDGFYLYANTESVMRDMPQLGAGAGMVLVTWNGPMDSTLRPSVFIYDLDQLKVGNTAPRVTRLSWNLTGISAGSNQALLPLNVMGATLNTASPVAAVGRNGGGHLDGWIFKKDFIPPVDAATVDIGFAQNSSSDGHLHMPRSTIRLDTVNGGVYSGNFYSTGTNSGRSAEVVTQVPLSIDVNGTEPVVTQGSAVGSSVSTAGFFYRIPVLSVDNNGKVAVVYGREGNPVTTASSTWFSVVYSYPFATGTGERILKAGLSQLDRGGDMDFVEGASDPKTGGIWAIYRSAEAGGNYANMIGRAMP